MHFELQKTFPESKFKYLTLFKNEERLLKEFNKDFKIKLDASLLKNDNSTSLNNNDGYTRYKGNLKKILILEIFST